jgi:hypothetical protein
MNVSISRVETFTITMSREEVLKLKSLTQNPYMYLDNPEDEPKDYRDFRELIWTIFKEVK